jgi:hypothetical protein
LILLYGVADGQAVGFCGWCEGSHKKQQRQRAANYIQKAAHEAPPIADSEIV